MKTLTLATLENWKLMAEKHGSIAYLNDEEIKQLFEAAIKGITAQTGEKTNENI